MTSVHMSTSRPLLYHSQNSSEDSEVFFISSTRIRWRIGSYQWLDHTRPSVTAYRYVHYRPFHLIIIFVIQLHSRRMCVWNFTTWWDSRWTPFQGVLVVLRLSGRSFRANTLSSVVCAPGHARPSRTAPFFHPRLARGSYLGFHYPLKFQTLPALAVC